MSLEASCAGDPAADPLLPHWAMLGSMTLPGRPEQVSEARRFVARTIGDDPRSDAALLLTSEVVTNAVVHSRSRLRGGTVVVVVARNAAGLLVTVTDNGSDTGVPVVRNSSGTESGNGLLLVETLADVWGYQRNTTRTTVWFRLGTVDLMPPRGNRVLLPVRPLGNGALRVGSPALPSRLALVEERAHPLARVR